MLNKKEKILLISGLIITLCALIVYTLTCSVISIAAVLAKYHDVGELTTSSIIIINKALNFGIMIELGTFALFELSSFIAFIYKWRKIELGLFILNIALGLIVLYNMIFNGSGTGYIILIPIINSAIYLLILKNKQDIDGGID